MAGWPLAISIEVSKRVVKSQSPSGRLVFIVAIFPNIPSRKKLPHGFGDALKISNSASAARDRRAHQASAATCPVCEQSQQRSSEWYIKGEGSEAIGSWRRLSDGVPRPLLRTRSERPRGCGAEQRDERAPPHSITSSASCWRCKGTSRPSALAVLRLIASMGFVGNSIGKCPGFATFRIL